MAGLQNDYLNTNSFHISKATACETWIWASKKYMRPEHHTEIGRVVRLSIIQPVEICCSLTF